MLLLKELPNIVDRKDFPWSVETPLSIYQSTIDYPKITIITPSYNQGQFLEETIRSVLLQNYPNLEFIVIDGGSTDNSVEIIKQYAPWIDYWVSESDSGQSNAINKGLEKATGSVVNWLNSDDWYLPNCLEIVGRNFALNHKIKAVSGISLMIRENEIVKRFRSKIGQSREESIAKLDIAQPSTFFKSEVFEKKILETMHFMFDAEIWTGFLLTNDENSLKTLDKPLVYYRLHNASKTVALDTKFQDDRRILLSALQQLYPQDSSTIDVITKPLVTQILKRWQQEKILPLNISLLHAEIEKAYFELAFLEKDYTTARRFAKKTWYSYRYQPAMLFKLILLILPNIIINKIRAINRLF
jgi:glycosyltransferase involved in cell wall biosynthesis